MAASILTDDALARIRSRMEMQADTANDPDTRDDALAILAALDELAQHRQSRKQQIGNAGLAVRLLDAVDRAGGQAAFRRAHGISQGYLCGALHTAEEPGPKILKAIGVKKRVVYEIVDEPKVPPVPRAGVRHPVLQKHEGEASCHAK